MRIPQKISLLAAIARRAHTVPPTAPQRKGRGRNKPAPGPHHILTAGMPLRYGFAGGLEAGACVLPKISAAIRVVLLAAGKPQYNTTNSITSFTCSLVQPFSSSPLA